MKFKKLALSLTIIPFFVFGWATPPGTEKHTLKAMVSEMAVKQPLVPPFVNEMTNKTFYVTGTTYTHAEVHIIKNGQPLTTVQADSEGAFFYRIPLQPAETLFEFYVLDNEGKASPKTALTVANQEKPRKAILSAPLVKQLPELARGCEVTSLAMLLNYAGVEADKMILAKEVTRDPAKMQVIDGKIHFGNPYHGFVGDMYTFNKPGLGVYADPIEELASKYMPERIVNLTGHSFNSVLNYLAAGHPVWVIVTSTFDHVPATEWETWHTEQGPIQVTSRMHSVLLTGYDSEYVYFNDPLDDQINKKIPKESFIKGWEQFGGQAISYF